MFKVTNINKFRDVIFTILQTLIIVAFAFVITIVNCQFNFKEFNWVTFTLTFTFTTTMKMVYTNYAKNKELESEQVLLLKNTINSDRLEIYNAKKVEQFEKEIDKRNKITKLDHYIAKLDNKHYRSLKRERKKNELREWAYEYKQALMRKENIEHFEKIKSLSSIKVNYEKINSSKLFTYGRNSKIRKTKYTFSPMLSSLNRGLIPTVFSLCISLLFGTLQDDSYLQSGKVWLDLMSYLFSIGLGSWWGMTNGKAIIQEDYLEVLNNVALLIRDVKNTIFKEKEKGVISSGN